jgi:threonine aldolase
MGGGMRQAGILAAAGIIALTEERKRIAEDHRRAKTLARFLSDLDGVQINVESVEINMVFFSYPPAADPERAEHITEIFRKRGIIINPPEKGLFRFVTHRWTGDGEIAVIMEACAEAFGGRR